MNIEEKIKDSKDFLLNEITVGQECNLPLDPSCIKFAYTLKEEFEDKIKYVKVTHKYKEVTGHSVSKKELVNEYDTARVDVRLLGCELADIVYCLVKAGDYQYVEQLIDNLNQQIEDGYSILLQYDNIEWEFDDE